MWDHPEDDYDLTTPRVRTLQIDCASIASYILWVPMKRMYTIRYVALLAETDRLHETVRAGDAGAS